MTLDPARIAGLARADWLERSRRPAFLVLLGVGLWAAWAFTPPNDGSYATFRMMESRGLYGSAWIGSTVALLTSLFFSLAGFYVVKNAVAHDRRTGVGPVLATTPMGNVEYVLAKWLSGTGVLAALTLVMVVGAAAMQFVRAEDPAFHPLALLAPFVWIALPAMAWTAAFAVAFETVPGLRGGIGNFAYFFLWIAFLLQPASVRGGADAAWDPLGIHLLIAEMLRAGREHIPGFAAHPDRFSIGLNFRTGGWHLSTFPWDGVRWTPAIVLTRIAWLAGAAVLAALAALPFDRFAGESRLPARGRSRAAAADPEAAMDRTAPARLPPRAGARFLDPGVAARPSAGSLPMAAHGFAGATLFIAEMGLLFRGASWGWWLTWLAIQLPGMFAPHDVAARFASVAWIWPALRWSALGARERTHGTTALLDASPHPISRQLPATWLAGMAPGLIAGAGFAIRSALAGDVAVVNGWLIGAAFVPALALALGTLTGGRKTFEIVYVILWYVGPLNGLELLDFTGASGAGALPGFAVAALALAAVAGFARDRRIRTG